MSSQLPPADVISHILSFFDPDDRRSYHSCLLTCRYFYSLAAPHLYHTLRLSSYDHCSPFFDANPTTPPSRGALAKRRGAIGKVARSRKGRLLDGVKVVEVDGKVDGPFAGIKAVHLPSIRTLIFDMSSTQLQGDRKEYRTWVDGNKGDSNAYNNLAGMKPKTIVLKHLSFHETIDLPDCLPTFTRSQVTRLIYIIDYSAWDSEHFGRIYGPSGAITSFGLHQWLDNLSDPPEKLRNVDIVFWTPAPGLLFTTPGNKYTYMRPQPGQTWLDHFVAHFAEVFPTPGSIQFSFVNAGSFDRHAINAQDWVYDAVEQAFMSKLLRELGPGREGKVRPKDIVRAQGMRNWMLELERNGVEKKDIFTAQEIDAWMSRVDPMTDAAEAVEH